MSLLLAVAGRWGYHRDEPYSIICGRRRAWGYVDQPPLTPALAGRSDAIFTRSLTGFRLLPALVSSSLLIVAAATAHQLGASHRGAAIAALATLACPTLLAGGHWFRSLPFDQLIGALIMLVWAHLLAGGDRRWWLLIGVLIGLGLENKWTVLLVVTAVASGSLLSDELRGDILTPWPWLTLVLAAAVWAPNLRWQIRNGWPSLRFIRDNRAIYRHDEGWAAFVWQQLGVLGIPLLVLVAIGLTWGWGEPGYRPAVVGIVIVVTALAAVGAKPYYHAAFLPFLFAAGATAADDWVDSSQVRLVGSIAVWGVAAIPFTLPVLPPRIAANFGVLASKNQLGEEVGWSELVDQVAGVIDDLPEEDREGVKVITKNYGEAAILELLGPRQGIPPGTALSGHNSFATWWPDDEPAGTVVTVGFDPAALTPFFESCERVAHVRNQIGVKNQLAGSPVLLCQKLKVSAAELRDGLRFTG